MAEHFHLALPCLSITKTRAFYNEVLGAQIGRSSIKWLDINFYNHQITFTESGPFNFESKSYAFNAGFTFFSFWCHFK
jgi:extradiol dioxygenase family protein